jgi:GH43 family beta-xylosidase
MKRLLLLLIALSTLPALQAQPTFTNPLLPSGADPSVAMRDHIYYYMQTTGSNLTIWKTRDLTDLAHAEKTVVWTPPAEGPYSKEIWAPELHLVQNKWYIYFAADAGANETHRIWVLENDSPDPTTGEWVMKGKLADETDRWAIDPSIFEDAGQLYVIWSGWEGAVNGAQNIYIARMKNPWTIDGVRSRISAPQYPWEKVGDLDTGANGVIAMPHVDVNEGPEILTHGSRIFLIYSASGCWTNYYELGMLTATSGSDLLNPASWVKSDHSVFRESPQAQAFGTGHNTFFTSPDGTEQWLLYHANPAANQGCGSHRAPRAQRFTWNADGTPNFGEPIPLGTPIAKPSGTPAR